MPSTDTRAALEALVQLLDGQMEPLHPVSWLTVLEQGKRALARSAPEERGEGARVLGECETKIRWLLDGYATTGDIEEGRRAAACYALQRALDIIRACRFSSAAPEERGEGERRLAQAIEVRLESVVARSSHNEMWGALEDIRTLTLAALRASPPAPVEGPSASVYPECLGAGCPICGGSGAAAPVEGERERVIQLEAALLDCYDAAQNARGSCTPTGSAWNGKTMRYDGERVTMRSTSEEFLRGHDAGACSAAAKVHKVVTDAGLNVRGPWETNRDAGRYPPGPKVRGQCDCGRPYGEHVADCPAHPDYSASPAPSAVPYRVPTTYCPAHGTRFWCEPAGDEGDGYCSRCASPAPSAPEEER